VSGISIDVAGLVLMIVGAVGLLFGLFFLARGRAAGVPPPGELP
jgi:hypothetical protein